MAEVAAERGWSRGRRPARPRAAGPRRPGRAGDGRERPRGLPAQPAGDDRVRRRHPRRPSARRGDLPAGAGALRARARRDQPRVRHPQDDGDAGAAAGACRTGAASRAGAMADLVVFDPATIADRATAMQPQLAPVGIAHVLVNGVAVVWDGQARPPPAPAAPSPPLTATPRECRASPAARPARRPAGGSRRSRPGRRASRRAYQTLSGYTATVMPRLQCFRQLVLLTMTRPPSPRSRRHGLQLLVEGDRALGRAGPLGVVRRPLVDAHQDVTLGLGHGPPESSSIDCRINSGRTNGGSEE